MVLASARSNADARVVATQYGADAFRGKVATGDVGLTTDESSAFRDVESYPVHRIKDDDRQGALQGLLASLTNISAVVGPVLFTVLYSLTAASWNGWVWLVGPAVYLFAVPSITLVRNQLARLPSRR